ncbi:MAG: hypothetical protein AB1390_05125 [Nitrospirota bacterium]
MLRSSRIFPVIFLCSLSSLAYEISLTRIFSVSLWYHFAFMIISIAMLGIGLSGTILSLYPRLRDLSNIGTYSFFLGTGIFLSYLITNQIPFDPVKLSWSRIQILYIGIYYIVISLPFFFTGLVIATFFSQMSERAGLFYAADLLGAGTGSLGILYLMYFVPTEKAIFIVSSMALLATFLAGGRKLKTAAIALIAMNIALAIIHPSFVNLKMSPYKGLNFALNFPGAEHLETYHSPYTRIDTFKSPAVRFAPGLSLIYLDNLPEQVGFSIDGGQINAITSYGNERTLKFLEYLPSALPYEILSSQEAYHGDILVLDPRGGLQVLVAGFYDFPNIYKIESNPLLMKVINEDFNKFSGGIYARNAIAGIGRAWLKNSGKEFDIIDIPLTGASPSGTFGISEDYRFTVEAFKEYIGHLKKNGILSINLFILPPPRIELRILSTAVEAMEKLGFKDVERHIVGLRSWGTIGILIKKSPFTNKEVNTVKEFSSKLWFDIVHYPGMTVEETDKYVKMPSADYFSAFKQILDPYTRDKFLDSYIFDVKYVRDENPFFSYYLKIANIKEIYKIMGEKWQYFIEEGYILPVVFIQVLILSLILIFLPFFSVKKPNVIARNTPQTETKRSRFQYKSRQHGDRRFLPYFAFLGTGFMFIEVSIVHKMILPLENPSYALATVLTSLLLSSGIGSLLSHRFHSLQNYLIPLLISVLIALYSIFLTAISDFVSPHSIILKILLVFAVLMPLGLFMGIPFPTGLKMLGQRSPFLIPWAWAINGCLSVLTPILTIMMALIFGFKIVFWLGAFSYLAAFLFMKNFAKKLSSN